MTKETVISILKERTKDDIKITEVAIEALVNGTDIDAGLAEIKNKYTITVWDKVSPINGAPPSAVLNSAPHNIEGWEGLTYLISLDGSILYLQPNDFTQPGWTPITTEARALELADEQISKNAEEGVISSLLTVLRGE